MKFFFLKIKYNNPIKMEIPQVNPIEDQRKQALEHYEEAARIACHWSSFVRDAILAYNPTPSPVDGEKEEPREREFRITKNYEDGTSEVTCLRINGEKWVKESEQASRIKALEEQLAFEIRVANAQTEIAKELAQEKEALEERLEAAENVVKCVPLQGDDNGLFGRNIYLPGFNEALEAYNKLKH